MRTLSRHYPTKKIRLPQPIVATTSGRGLWSTEKRKTVISRVVVHVSRDVYDGEMCVFVSAPFAKRYWDTSKHGLIYTDSKWLKEFANGVVTAMPDIFAKNIDYTEQGMQGSSHVSMSMNIRGAKKIDMLMKALKMNINLRYNHD